MYYSSSVVFIPTKEPAELHVFCMSKYGRDCDLYFICYKNKVGSLEKLDTDNQL